MASAAIDRMCREAFEACKVRWAEYNKEQDQRLWKGGIVKAKEYEVLRLAVEEGVCCGVNRYNKYADEETRLGPGNEDMLVGHVEEQVLNAICEWFDFDSSTEEPE